MKFATGPPYRVLEFARLILVEYLFLTMVAYGFHWKKFVRILRSSPFLRKLGRVIRKIVPNRNLQLRRALRMCTMRDMR